MTTDVGGNNSNSANATAESSKSSNDSVRILSTLTRLVARNTAIEAVHATAEDYDAAGASAVSYALAGEASGKRRYDFAGVAVFDDAFLPEHEDETTQTISGYVAVAIQSLPPEYRKSALEYKPIELRNRRIVALKGCALVPIVIEVPYKNLELFDASNPHESTKQLDKQHALNDYLKKFSRRPYKFSIVDTKLLEPVANSITIAMNTEAAVADAKAAADFAQAHVNPDRSIEDLLARCTEELALNNSNDMQASLSQLAFVQECGMCVRSVDNENRNPTGNTVRLLRFSLKRYLAAYRMTPLRYLTEVTTFLQSLPSPMRIRAAESILNSDLCPTYAIDFKSFINSSETFAKLQEPALFYRSAIAEQAEAQRLNNFYLRKNPEIANQFSPQVHTAAIKLQRILQMHQDTDYSALNNNKLIATPDDISAYIELHTKNSQFMMQSYIKKLMRTATTAASAFSASSATASASAFGTSSTTAALAAAAVAASAIAADAAAFAATVEEASPDAALALASAEAKRNATAMPASDDTVVSKQDCFDPYLDCNVFEVSKFRSLPDDQQCVLILGETTVIALERIQSQLVKDMLSFADNRNQAPKLLGFLIYAGLSCGHSLNLLCTMAVEQVCSSNLDHDRARWSERFDPSSCLLQVLLHSGCNLMHLSSQLMSYLLKVNTVSKSFGLAPYTATNKYDCLAMALRSTDYAKQNYGTVDYADISHSQLIELATHINNEERAFITQLVQSDDLYAYTQGLGQLRFAYDAYKSSKPRYSKTALALLSLMSDKSKALAHGIARHYIEREYKLLQNSYLLQTFGYKDVFSSTPPQVSDPSEAKVYKQMYQRALALSVDLQARLFNFTSDIRFLIGLNDEAAVSFISIYQSINKSKVSPTQPILEDFFLSYALGIKYLQLCIAILTGTDPAAALATDAATSTANAAEADAASAGAAAAAGAAGDEQHAALLSGYVEQVEKIEAGIGSVLHVTTKPDEHSSFIELDAESVYALLMQLQHDDSDSYAIVSRLLARSRAIEPEEMSHLIFLHSTEVLKLPHSFSDLSMMLTYVDSYGNTVSVDHSDEAFLADLRNFDLDEAPELNKRSVQLLCIVADDLIHSKGIFGQENADPEVALKTALLLAEPNLLKLTQKYELEFNGLLTNKAIHRYREQLTGVTVFKLMLAMHSGNVITSLRPETVDSFLYCMSLIPTDSLDKELKYLESTTADTMDPTDGITNVLRGDSWTIARIIFLVFYGVQRRISMHNDPQKVQYFIEYYKTHTAIDPSDDVPECLNYEMDAEELKYLAKIFCNTLLNEYSELLTKLIRAIELQDALNTEIKAKIADKKMTSLKKLNSKEQTSFKRKLTNSLTMTEHFRQALATTIEYSLDSLDEPKQMLCHSLADDAPKLSELIANSEDLSAIFKALKPHDISMIIHTMAHASNSVLNSDR